MEWVPNKVAYFYDLSKYLNSSRDLGSGPSGAIRRSQTSKPHDDQFLKLGNVLME